MHLVSGRDENCGILYHMLFLGKNATANNSDSDGGHDARLSCMMSIG